MTDKKIVEDKIQKRVLRLLEPIYTELHKQPYTSTIKIETNVATPGWFSLKKPSGPLVSSKTVWRSVKGAYMHGSPGCGKTFMMDMFYDLVEIPNKRRVHFNKFMLEVHQHIHNIKKNNEKQGDPIPKIGLIISEKTRLLCFDEFQVTDIADAMILKRLFATLWDQGVVMISTSNRPPDDLYYNGLQRSLFLPFIDDLKANCTIIDIDSVIDYRKAGEEVKSFLYPLNNDTESKAYKIFTKITGQDKGKPCTIDVMQGRSLTCMYAWGTCGMFSFCELCEKPLGAADYIAIAEYFQYVIITDVPSFDIYKRDIMRRWILLIDELYNKKVQLFCTAVSPIEELFKGETGDYDEIFAFQRTVSRLIEMQTTEYQRLPHS